MTLDQALLLGVLQGATEFLPVSSSGHLALARSWLPGVEGPRLLFNVVVHLGTLAAIGLVLRSRLLQLLRAAVELGTGRRTLAAAGPNGRWLGLLLLGSVPTALIGLGLHDVVQAMQLSPLAVGGALIGTAIILVASERVGSRSRGAEELGMRDALIIGVVQGLAVLPGISRSGSTIAAALWRDVRAEVAVEFSILLSVPAILGATLLELTRTDLASLTAQALPLGVGFVAAFVVGCGSLRLLGWLVGQRRLLPCAAYCAALGVGAIGIG